MKAQRDKQYCFFGTLYEGDHCKCGWTKEMLKEVPDEYFREGQLKFYQLYHYKVAGTNRDVLIQYLL
jgi:hypothetical protein